MNRVLVDTNIVIDLLAKREDFYPQAAELFSMADRGEVQLYVSSLTFANTNYILSKLKSAAEARRILIKFKVLVRILNLDDKIIQLALSDIAFTDFEDGLQYHSALENEIDIIITRIRKDFKNSVIPVLSAEEFLAGI